MSKYTSCSNFVKKYWFLRKLRHFLFLPIYKNIDQDLRKSQLVPFSKKTVNFEVKKLGRQLSPFSALDDALKSNKLLRLSKKFSMCKIENVASGAKLPPQG